MATSQINRVIQHLRRTVLLRDGAGLTDGQLLEDYISRRDEAALAALVRRHGPLVWGVCRRVLRNYHDAEDAFQATFLVLVRKVASIVPREMVANWLYGVAHQTALKARATAAKRKGRERQVKEMPEPAAVEQDLWRDLQAPLDEELSRLPDKYRAVIVLCDLEGKTRKVAARQLGVPEGTVAGWLSRARTMLARRLTQRGVALSGGALAAVLSQRVASAGVPSSVVSSTIKAATLFAAGQGAGVISVKVAALTEGVLKSMLLTKLNIASAVLLVLAVAIGGVGAGGLLHRTQAGEPQKVADKKEVADGDDDEPGFPGAPPPLQGFAIAMKDATIEKGGKKVKTDVLLLTVRSDGKSKDDNPPPTTEEKVEGGKALAPSSTAYYDLNDVQAFDTKGKRIEAKKLPDLLKKKTAVLVSADGRPVDPFYLQLVKDSTVVLILEPAPKNAEKPKQEKQQDANPAFVSVLPKGEKPVQALVRLDKGELVVRTIDSKEVAVQKNGVTTFETVETPMKRYYKVENVQVQDTKGKEIDKKELPKLVRGEIVALVVKGGRPVDPLHLQLCKEGTLLFLIRAPEREEEDKAEAAKGGEGK